MASDGSGGPKNSLSVSIGKELDAALGDMIRGLTKRPSEAIGDFLADGIGIVGDRIKRKRELNAKLGMEEVQRILDTNGVSMKDITPPKEEELHLLLNGISLADDNNVRNMWAGLFAKALEPSSEIIAERPFISLLESLSSLDAKVIDLLAFIERTNAELKTRVSHFAPKDLRKITLEEKERARITQIENAELQKKAVSSILQKATDYGLSENIAPNWADNLLRQGIIEVPPVVQYERISAWEATIRDDRDLSRAVVELQKALREVQEISKRESTPPKQLFTQDIFTPQLKLEAQFTTFGLRFASACGLI